MARRALHRWVLAWTLLLGILVAVLAVFVFNPGTMLPLAPQRQVLAEGRSAGFSWRLRVWTGGRTRSLCMSVGNRSGSAAQCGFGCSQCGPAVDSADLGTVRLVAGPAPAGTRTVQIQSRCSPRDDPDSGHHGRVVASVATHQLPSWAPRSGEWFIYKTKPGDCAIGPGAYFSEDGQRLKLGTF